MRHLILVTKIGVILSFCGAAVCDSMAQQPAAPLRLNNCQVKWKQQAEVASKIAGVLESVKVKEGDLVKEGQLLAQLDDEVEKTIVEPCEKNASNDVEIRYALKNSEYEYGKYEEVLKARKVDEKAVSEIEVRKAKLAAEKGRLQIEQAQHRFAVALLNAKQARARLNLYRVHAPFDGIVTKVFKSKGEGVRQADPIVEIVNTDEACVEGYINADDLGKVKRGTVVRIELENQKPLEGRIVFIDVNIQPDTGKVRIWADVANRDDLLRAGQTVTMVIGGKK